MKLITGDIYVHQTYNMGTGRRRQPRQFLRRQGPRRRPRRQGARQVRRPGLPQYVAERVEPWSYLKFPYLKKVGWKGLVDGADSGVYKATPLSRLNAADGMATPLAQAEYEKFYETLGGKPVHHTLATHWARLIELLYAAEHWVELAHRPGDHQQGVPRAADARRRPRAWAASRPRGARSPTTTRPTSAAFSPRST